MSYSPEALGAKCHICPLKGCTVVPTEKPDGNGPGLVAIVGEAPGEEEEKNGRPFIGASGRELDAGLRAAGIDRRRALVTNTMLCRPQVKGNKLDVYLRRLKKEDDTRHAERLATWEKNGRLGEAPKLVRTPSPMECCRPRLETEIANYRNFITLGKVATNIIAGTDGGIMPIRGGMRELDATEDTPGRRVMPTIHPAFVLRQQRWRHVFRNDLYKASRHFQGQAEWKPPEIVYNPSPDQLEAFLKKYPKYAFDTETDWIESLTAKLRCIAIGTDREVYVVGVEDIKKRFRFYSETAERRIRAILKAFFENPDIVKIGHNCVHGGTPVILADGTSAPIDSLVKGNYSGAVWGFENGRVVRTPVVAHFKQRGHGRWVVIRTGLEKKGSRGLTVTPDHLVYTNRGLIRADAVRPGDFLFTREVCFSDDQRSAIIGTVLGDSHLVAATSTPTGSIRVAVDAAAKVALRGGHTNRDLVEQKLQWLGAGKIREEASEGGFKPHTMHSFRLEASAQLAGVAKLTYKQGARVLTAAALDALGPVGWAWWFADDGFKHSGKVNQPLYIAACRYSDAEREVARAWLERFGAVSVTKNKCLALSVAASGKFAAWIAPYLLPAARYKLPMGAHPDFVGFPDVPPTPLAVEVIEVECRDARDWGSPSSRSAASFQWCLQTTTGNFFTAYGLVANSGSYDKIVLREQWGIELVNNHDTMLLHRAVESELPHGLAYVGSLYSDAPAWKSDREGNKLSTQSETNEQLHEYCIFEGTGIVLSDGEVRPIEELVRSEYDGLVLTVDDTGSLSTAPVTDWFYTVEDSVSWWQIILEGASARERGLVTTIDHVVYTTRGAVRSDEVQVGDRVLIAERGFSKDEEAAALGTLIGDSILTASPSRRGGAPATMALAGGHAAASGNASWKVSELSWLKLSALLPAREMSASGRTGHAGEFQTFRSDNLFQLAELRSLVVDDEGARRLYVSTLKRMGPRGWAWWLVDDGCRQKKSQETWQENLVFSTQRYPEGDLQDVVTWVRSEFGPASVGADGVLRLSAEASVKFAQQVAPYVPRQARYKLPGGESKWCHVEYVPVEAGNSPASRRVAHSRPYLPDVSTRQGLYRSRRRYCLRVEGTHRFFTTNGLVHNCALDTAVTYGVFEPLAQQVILRDQQHVYNIDLKMQEICVEMHSNGMYVDQEKRLKEEQRLLKARHQILEEIRETAEKYGFKNFNPGSIYQIRDLFFDKWGLVPSLPEEERFTESDDPSTNDNVLRTLLCEPTVSESHRDFIKKVRRYRKLQKVLGTYVCKLRYEDTKIDEDLGWDEDEEWLDVETRKRYGLIKQGIVYRATGRMHPGYNAHVANCVTPGTWILTKGGPRQLGNLHGFGPAGSERAIADLSLSDGQRLHAVSHLQNPGFTDVIKMTTVLGVTLTATPHHQVQVSIGDRRSFLRQDSSGKWHSKEPSAVWRRMDGLSVGDYIRVPIGMEVWGSSTEIPVVARQPQRTNALDVFLPTRLDEDLAFFLGVYNADGSRHASNGSFSIRISDTRNRRSAQVLAVAQRLFGLDAVRLVPGEGVTVTSISLKAWADELGLKAGILNKKTPPWILAAPRHLVLAYLRGLAFDSHGGLNGGTTLSWTYTGTETLCREFQMLLLNLGIAAGVYDRTTEKSAAWLLVALGSDARAVSTLLEVPMPEPEREVEPRPKYIRRGNTLWLRVKSVEPAGVQPVLDVTIPEAERFWANGTVSHNTGRLSSSKPINCYDSATEILTENGWVAFPDLQPGARVAQWHPEGRISFTTPTEYHNGRSAEMIHLQSRAVDLLVTPNHRMLFCRAEELDTPLAQDVAAARWWEGRRSVHAGQYTGGRGLCWKGRKLSVAALQFLVAAQVDSWWAVTNGKRYGLCFAFSKERKQVRLREIAAELGLTWTESTSPDKLIRYKGETKTRIAKGATRFYFQEPPDFLELLGSEKLWGAWILRMCTSQLQAFTEELWHWDGCLSRQSQYATKHRQNADWVQAALVLTGHTAKIRYYTNSKGNAVWIVDASEKAQNGFSRSSSLSRKVGDFAVYCVTVPTGFIVVRRSGKAVISSNSQNFPKGLRGLVVASPGCVLVGADADQLELRIAAAHWQVPLYLRAFMDGKDPHSMTAYTVFGDAFLAEAGLTKDQFERPGPFVGKCYDNGSFDGDKAPDAKKMRDLSKAIQYASIKAGVKIALLQEKGSAAIEDVQPGDWVWSWSTKRFRYEPARVKHVWNHGKKECVKVTFSWEGGNSASVELTADHPMLLRNGVLRHAGSLKSGDRLMPFFRRKTPTAAGKFYRRIRPHNTGVMVGEHRVVKGFYEKGQRHFHVHHKDHNTLNNHPDNLEVLPGLVHYAHHKAAVDAGRIKSAKWRSSVADPKTRSSASVKAWVGRRQRRATDKNFGPRASKLDAFAHLIGVETDEQVAAKAGCTAALVGMYRKAHRINPPVGQKGWLRWLLRENVLWLRLLHDYTDVEMAELISREFSVEVTRDAVAKTRRVLGVPVPVRDSRSDKGKRRGSKLDAWAERIGHEADSIIAKEAGATLEAVAYYRKVRGIPAYWREAPGGNNHEVVSVEPAGVFEVWDLEVDHEDHNFALEAGIFVHNSQYMGSPETVHKLVQKTEVPAKGADGKPLDDGTTVLPYAQMPLRRVREMRQNWLDGAPEFTKGWEREIQEFKDKGFLLDPVHKRRRDFLDGADEVNQIVNFKIQCVPGHVRVLTDRGYVPIASLTGQLFKAWTGKKWASATCISKGEASLVRLSTNHALSLLCDSTHKFKVPDRSNYVWREVTELGPGNRVALDRARPLEFGVPVDPEDAYMLGLWLADGSMSLKNKGRGRSASITWAVGDQSKSGPAGRSGLQQVRRIQAWAESKGLRALASKQQGCTAVRVDGLAAEWAELWGLRPGGARLKRIPERIWCADLQARKAFFRGLLDGDGYQAPNKSVFLNLFNPELLEEVAVLIRTVGVDAHCLNGPYRTNRNGETVSWRLRLSAAHLHEHLGWGEPAKYRSDNTTPQFECTRVLPRLVPQTRSHQVIRSRIKGHAGAKGTSPYTLAEMGVDDLYDHGTISSVSELTLKAEVFTLCVDDEEHAYVAEGFISKNSSAAGLMNSAIFLIYDEVVKRRKIKNWPKHCGIINQCHDSIVLEVPEEEGEWAADLLNRAMNQYHPALPGVKFTAKAKIGKTWKEVG